ncbi:MAG: HlyD family efflux transporter periplasmic adaptor subunit [Planctomycetes bacterium]|nr:HlyD family efflux transporter periplasmic adaptor subunit [Planctomycetota bacterium]
MSPQVSPSARNVGTPPTAELIDRLSRFDGPPELFLVNLLAVQCHLASADGGAILRASGKGGQSEVLAIYPQLAEESAIPVWLAQAVELAPQVVAAGVTAVNPLHGPDDMYGQRPGRFLVMVPLRGGQGVRGLATYTIRTSDPAVLEAGRERLEITVSLLSLYEMRLTLQRRHLDFQRVRTAMETLSAINEHNRFAGAAMAASNEIAARWQAERVSFGVLKGRYVHLKATSHTEKFSRKMKLVQDIESTMEECLDQDVEVLYPASAEVAYANRAAGELSKHHGPSVVLSMPLRYGGEVQAVLTVERPSDRPFDLEEIETLRLTGELCTARLLSLHEMDRWFGARLAATVRKGLAAFLGPKHTWAKVAAILVFAAVVFLVFAKGQYRVHSSFAMEAIERRIVPAPYNGELAKVFVDPGDQVSKGQLLAQLKKIEIEVQLAKAKADRIGREKERQSAMQQGKRFEEQVAAEEIKKIAAEIELLRQRIDQADLVAPCDGYVLVGDLKKQIGAPLETGTPLFEVGPLDSLRAELSVPEDQIADVISAMKKATAAGREVEGELATVSEPGRRIEFVVERIIPVAEVVDQRNVFKVWARLQGVDLGRESTMRPGLEGVAKISIERRRYAWIWTRKPANWLRMKLWL